MTLASSSCAAVTNKAKTNQMCSINVVVLNITLITEQASSINYNPAHNLFMGGHGAQRSLGCIQDVQLVCATLSIVATKKEDLVSFQSTNFRMSDDPVKIHNDTVCGVFRENGPWKVETRQARDQSGWQCGHAILQATEEGEGMGRPVV